VPDPQFPFVRSLQKKLDDIVSVKDFGARGDFDIDSIDPFTSRPDDTGPVLTAMKVLYDDAYNLNSPASQNPNSHDPRSSRAIYFPAGVYRITRSMLLYPFTTIIGDGEGKTIIYLDNSGTNVIDVSSVARTVDSTGSNTSGSPFNYSNHIKIHGVTFQAYDTDGTINLLELENVNSVFLNECGFVGSRTSGSAAVPSGSNGVNVKQTLATATFGSPSNYTFRDCYFTNTQVGFNAIEEASNNILLDNCRFSGHWKPVKTGYDSNHDQSSPFGTTAGPSYIKVANSHFDNYDNIGWDVRTTNKGCVSTNNYFSDNLVEPAILLSLDVTNFVSTADTFENTDVVDCDDFITSFRVRNLSTSEEIIIINAQDKLVTGKGLCNVSISGDLTLSGCIVYDTDTITVTGGSNIVFEAAQIKGNVLFYEYGMKNADAGSAGTAYRVGKVMVVHDGTSLVAFNHEYSDDGAVLANPVTLTANLIPDLDPTVAKIQIVADTGTIPNTTFVHACRLLTI
jgi:hypothetical protein